MPAHGLDDLKNSGINLESIPPATYTTTQVGTACDMTGTQGPIRAIIQLGAISDTSTAVVTFTECATSGGSYTAITGAPTVTLSATGDNAVTVSDLFERKLQYLKATLTLGGSSISAVVGVSFSAAAVSY